MSNSHVDPSAVKRWVLFDTTLPRPNAPVMEWLPPLPSFSWLGLYSNLALAVQLNNNQLCFIRRKQPR